MLEIKNVSKVFNRNTINEKQVLNNVNLTLEDGDFVTIVGGNGAGKSTLLNLIAGSIPLHTGQIILDGIDVSKLSEHKRAKYIGHVFQDPMKGTAANMQIQENLALAYRRGAKRSLKWGISKNEIEIYKKELSKFDLNLENRLSAKVGLLSGGQRQALTLLMASLTSPRLLLLDEHTAALDPKTASNVLDLTEKIVKENNLTAIMITHNMKDAIRLGNRLIMMEEGKIVYEARGKEKSNLKVGDLLDKFDVV